MPVLGTEAMRPKTFPAAPYVGNTRQRLQEIKEGLKQPAKLVSQALHGGSSRSEGGRGADSKSGKDTASRQQQLRPPQKFNNYQNALREIRKSLMPFANESGPSSGSGHPAGAGEVNRQMLQELVNAGCDQVSVFPVAVCVWGGEGAGSSGFTARSLSPLIAVAALAAFQGIRQLRGRSDA